MHFLFLLVPYCMNSFCCRPCLLPWRPDRLFQASAAQWAVPGVTSAAAEAMLWRTVRPCIVLLTLLQAFSSCQPSHIHNIGK